MTNQLVDYSDVSRARDHAWRYFALHAEQRIRTFNFFLVLSTVLIAGSLAAIREDLLPEYAGTLGLYALTLFSFVFWKLDQRNRTLIKAGESALKKLEAHLLIEKDSIDSVIHLAIFTHEDEAHNALRGGHSFLRFWSFPLTYSESFFAVFLIVGVLGAVLGSLLLFGVGS